MKRQHLVILFLLFFFSLQAEAIAQASLVPVYHQVYDWLHYQRVLGNAPRYNYEALPLTRGQITEILASISPSTLSKADNHVRTSYLREFSVDSLKKYETNSLLQGSDKVYNRLYRLIFSEEEGHVYVWDDDRATIAFDWFPGRGAVFVEDGDQNYTSPYYTYGGIRTYGTFYGVLGFHYEQWRAVQVGDDEAFFYLPFLTRNWKSLISKESINKHHLETFVGYHKDYWSVHIGRGTLKYGVGQRNNLVYSREGIPFDWFRFNINSKYVDFTSILGFLSWTSRPVREVDGYENLFTATSPNRFTVHQRIQFQPAHWISLGFYELINYSNRKIELGYLNPINRLSIMEWEMQDQDNGFAGFEGVLRPFSGMELFGEILIDDLGEVKDVFRFEKTKYVNSTFGRFMGLNYATRFGSVVSATYQRIDPNLYAHKFQLNTHADKGIGLGSQIGPNGDELSIGLTQWLSHRTRIQVRYDYDRHGMNYYDEEGNLIEDFGGDINDSYYIDPDTGKIIRAWKGFLSGDQHRWNRYTIEATYSPWRNITLTAEYSFRYMLEGEQLNNLSIFNVTFLIAN